MARASSALRRLPQTREFWTGALFTVLGLGFFVYAGQYRLGTLARMGPGYFPSLLAGLLVLLGLAAGARGLGAGATPLTIGRLQPIAVITLAILVFGLLLPTLGLVLATAALVLVSALASEQLRIKETLVLAILLALLAAGVFVRGLGVAAPLWPAF